MKNCRCKGGVLRGVVLGVVLAWYSSFTTGNWVVTGGGVCQKYCAGLRFWINLGSRLGGGVSGRVRGWSRRISEKGEEGSEMRGGNWTWVVFHRRVREKMCEKVQQNYLDLLVLRYVLIKW